MKWRFERTWLRNFGSVKPYLLGLTQSRPDNWSTRRMQKEQQARLWAQRGKKLFHSRSRILLLRSSPEARVSAVWLPTVLWTVRNQSLLGCCENDCCLTTTFYLQFSALQTPVVYQISPPSGIPGKGPFFRLGTTLLIIWCSIPSLLLLWEFCLAGFNTGFFRM